MSLVAFPDIESNILNANYHKLVAQNGGDYRPVHESISSLEPKDLMALNYDWRFWAREKQLPPEWEWFMWVNKGGRGSGKTWVGANLMNEWARSYERLGLIGRTSADVRDTMIEGESGILACSPPWFMPKYEPTKRRVVWPNGAFALCFSADEPNLLRGPQLEKAWADEITAWRKLRETLRNLTLALRIGTNPQCIVTSTPRPIDEFKRLLKLKTTHVTTMTTHENLENFPEAWGEQILQYEGTRLGRQELYGELLEDNPDALWRRDTLDKNRVEKYPNLARVVVAVDPPSAENPDESTAEAGIIVGGATGPKSNPRTHVYIIDDRSLGKVHPHEWGRQAVSSYYEHKADKIVAEANNGGAMVKSTIQAVDPNIKVELVYASRGKEIRAEPVAALDESGRIHHVGYYRELEDQLCEWVPGQKSPDRLDARVWLCSELLLGEFKRPTKMTTAVGGTR